MADRERQAQVNAPNIIIKPEHQSAPKVPVVPFRVQQEMKEAERQKGLRTFRGDYGDEMDLPQYNDPRIQTAIAEFQRNVMECTPQQTLEGLAAIKEKNMNDERTKSQRWEGQERWQGRENEEMRLVNIIHPHTFIRRLQQAGIAATFDAEDDGSPRNARIWLNAWSRVGRVGVNAWVYDPIEKKRVAKHITTLQYPYGPEWTIMRFDSRNVPTNERYRGWRTALLEMILKGVLTEDEARKAFGDPIGLAAECYKKQLFKNRQITLGLQKESA